MPLKTRLAEEAVIDGHVEQRVRTKRRSAGALTAPAPRRGSARRCWRRLRGRGCADGVQSDRLSTASLQAAVYGPAAKASPSPFRPWPGPRRPTFAPISRRRRTAVRPIVIAPSGRLDPKPCRAVLGSVGPDPARLGHWDDRLCGDGSVGGDPTVRASVNRAGLSGGPLSWPRRQPGVWLAVDSAARGAADVNRPASFSPPRPLSSAVITRWLPDCGGRCVRRRWRQARPGRAQRGSPYRARLGPRASASRSQPPKVVPTQPRARRIPLDSPSRVGGAQPPVCRCPESTSASRPLRLASTAMLWRLATIPRAQHLVWVVLSGRSILRSGPRPAVGRPGVVQAPAPRRHCSGGT